MRRPAGTAPLCLLHRLSLLRRHRSPGRILRLRRPVSRRFPRLERPRILSFSRLGLDRRQLLGVESFLAHGDISDVYSGRRARWPTELAILKRLRDPRDAELFDNEWHALQLLHTSQAPGSTTGAARCSSQRCRSSREKRASSGAAMAMLMGSS